jgi:hypothetical protein
MIESKMLEKFRADQLVIGDILLNDDGSYESTLEDVFTDESGTWIETSSGDIGYVTSSQLFYVENAYNE